jgi:hypothetical protein
MRRLVQRLQKQLKGEGRIKAHLSNLNVANGQEKSLHTGEGRGRVEQSKPEPCVFLWLDML